MEGVDIGFQEHLRQSCLVSEMLACLGRRALRDRPDEKARAKKTNMRKSVQMITSFSFTVYYVNGPARPAPEDLSHVKNRHEGS